MGAGVEIKRADRLEPGEAASVLELAQAAADADGVYPFSEASVLRLRHPDAGRGSTSVVHLLAQAGPVPAGYAQVDRPGPGEEPTAELCVHPAWRRRGIGRALATAALAGAAGRPRLWAHGDLPAANALARSLGLSRTRVLWQMRRSLAEPIPAPQWPAGVRLRAFRPGVDDEAWLAANARAFAGHPEQGHCTVTDLRMRMRAPWFDPEGFFLAVRESDGAILGFHWTKVPADAAFGEIYVLGVDPASHRSGLGTALALTGLAYLRDRGLSEARLYVDESNQAAVRLYQRLGFARFAADACFTRQETDSPT